MFVCKQLYVRPPTSRLVCPNKLGLSLSSQTVITHLIKMTIIISVVISMLIGRSTQE